MPLRGRRFDIALAVLLTVSTQVELVLADEVEGSRILQHACFALMTGALAFRRSHPLASVAAVAGGMAAQTILAGVAPVLGGLLAAIIGTYSVAAYASGRTLALGALAVLLGVVASGLVDEKSRTLADFGGNLVIFGVFFGLGLLLRRRGEEAAGLERDLADERQRAARALAEERARIARELHDVIAHHVSAMTMQAGAARKVLGREPQRALEPLEVVEEHGRRAIDEMRRLLGVLRQEPGGESSNGHAQPSLRGLDDLAEHVRRSGLEVELRTHGSPVGLPAGVDLAAYRIVQEALTNALKHSGGARAAVDVTYGSEEIEIRVSDDGPGGAEIRPGGHGLVGMRERASVYGGALEAGPRPNGGFDVVARLPLDPVRRP